MYALYKQFDKNGDGKITVEDIEIYLQEMGLGGVSPCMYRYINKLDYFNIELFRCSKRFISSC
jgi:Ca2+-binding EF-hand superfamily protein